MRLAVFSWMAAICSVVLFALTVLWPVRVRDGVAGEVVQGSGGNTESRLGPPLTNTGSLGSSLTQPGSVMWLQHTPCYAGDMSAVMRGTSYAVTTVDAAEVIAANSLNFVRENCPTGYECKVISVDVKYAEAKIK